MTDNLFYRATFMGWGSDHEPHYLGVQPNGWDESHCVKILRNAAFALGAENVCIERAVGELPLDTPLPWRTGDVKVIYDGPLQELFERD